MLHSIRWRLVASYIVLVLVTVGVVGLLAIEIVRQYAYQREVSELQANADVIAHQAGLWMNPSPHRFELSQLVRTTAFLGNVRVRILDTANNPLIDSGLPGEWNEMVWIAPPQGSQVISPDVNSSGLVIPMDKRLQAANQPNLQNSLPPGTSMWVIRKSMGPWGGRISFESLSTGLEKTSLVGAAEPVLARSDVVVRAPIENSSARIGYLELSSGPNYAAEALITTQQAVWLGGGGALLLATLLGLVMGSRLASPLHKLSETAVQMGSGNLSARATIHSKDEIGELARRFNLMADRLQASFQELATERDALRHFIADASHELRTPITALKNFNALLLGPAANDSQVHTEFLNESQVQIDRLEWITQNLLNLSRIDAGLVQLDFCECDSGELIQAAAIPFKALAIDKKIQLDLYLPEPPFSFHCDRPRMELCLSNLIDNALKYTPAGGRVEIGGERDGDHVRLWVQDTGPGIASEDLPRIFDRFYRSRTAVGPGSGLGLSIVNSLVQAHGGKVSVENRPEGGAKFMIEW
jgi:signal transduction histidine kinase